MNNFKLNTYIPCNVEEFNKHLKYCKENAVIYFRSPEQSEKIGVKAFLNIKEIEVELTYKKGKKVATYITRLDDCMVNKPSGMYAWQQVNRFYKVPRAKFPCNYEFSASAILYRNEKYDGIRLDDCYGYDINSAYTWAMCQPMPDTSVKPKIFEKVGKDEIGFDGNFNLVFTGKTASFVYPKIESPFKKFAEVWYKKKKEAKTKEEKQIAKDVLNASIGYFQRTNPILRTAIIWYANNRIKNLIDEDTLYCNTDSIISKKRRLDIENNLGDGLGQWKIEHQGQFAFKGYSYQWNNNIPSYRGIAKSWFPKGWDILKDEIPKDGNIYYYNEINNQIERKKHGKEE